MCDQSHAITMRQPSPEYVILDLCGFVNASFARSFEAISGSLHNLVAPNVVINFSGVKGIDGLGLKHLLVFCTIMRKLNRKLAAYGVNQELRQLFSLMRLDNLLRTCENEYQALGLMDGRDG